jgi:hypothetical protein
VKTLSRIEATSEDSRYPIKSAFEVDGHGWRAVEVGEQIIRLIFDEPQRIKRIQLCFMESDVERTQQFTLHWSPDQTGEMRPLMEQEWNFSPTGSTVEIENYEADLAECGSFNWSSVQEVGAAMTSPRWQAAVWIVRHAARRLLLLVADTPIDMDHATPTSLRR